MKVKKLSPYILTVAAAVAITAAGCGKSDEAPEKQSGPVTQVDPNTAATVTGTVAFEGAVPAQPPVTVTDDHCNVGSVDLPPEVTDDVVVTDGKLANVFVYVSKGLEGKRFQTPAEPAVLDQKGCRYHPHVLGVMVDQPLKIVNSDETLHNVHAQATKSDAFNLAQPTKGMEMTKTFDHEEIMVPFTCDVHGWMHSYVGVLTHPFFAVTPTNGSFSLKGLPPGTYTVTAWHEKYGTQQQQVTVGDKETKDISFTFKAG